MKTIVTVEGMMCPNCEKHVNEAIEANFEVKKVKSDRTKNETVIKSDSPLDREKLIAVISEAGYKATEVVEK